MTLPPLKPLIAGTTLLLVASPAVEAQNSRQSPSFAATRSDQENAAITHKLATIIIPRLEFHATTLEDAIEFLRQESRRLDPDPDPDARGVNILLRIPPPAAATQSASAAPPDASIPGLPAPAQANPAPAADARITLTLNRIPLLEALQYVALQAGLKLKVEAYAVSLVPLNENTESMVTAVFHVPAGFIGNAANGTPASALDQPASAAH